MKNTDRRNVAGMGHQQRDRYSFSIPNDKPISHTLLSIVTVSEGVNFVTICLLFLEQHIYPHSELRLF